MTRWLGLCVMALTFVTGLSLGGASLAEAQSLARRCKELADCLAVGPCVDYWDEAETAGAIKWMQKNCR